MENELIRQEEVNYLNRVIKFINETISNINQNLDKKYKTIQTSKKYMWENFYEMDSAEFASNNQAINMEFDIVKFDINKKRLLLKMLDTTYFGRIDFLYDGDAPEDIETYYIGIGGFTPENSFQPLVYDWRAPISSMYYDYDKGPASFIAPVGKLSGKITKKRQYKIKNGKLEYFLDTDITIDDEILQQELRHNSDNKMKNIVSTIQREQNSIIRNNSAQVMIVQGIAGSGKTSIALHRIAYILYNNRDKINSNNILIISPNHVFSDYISNVLPELGEENINEMSFEDLVKNELKDVCKFESKMEQVEFLLNKENFTSNRKKSIDYKSSKKFFELMLEFISEFEKNYITFTDCSFKNFFISKEDIKDYFLHKYANKPIINRFDWIADLVSDKYESNKNTNVNKQTRKELANEMKKMCKKTDIVEIYTDFIKWCSSKNSLISEKTYNKAYMYQEDVFPLIYFKYSLLGYKTFPNIKHLVIDEMQDYSQIHFEILNKIFNCKMTILGDIYQVLEQKDFTVLDTLKLIFKNNELIEMNKTYRSTYEISSFCINIINQKGVIPFNRHGAQPVLENCKNNSELIDSISHKIDSLNNKNIFNTIAVICKTDNEASYIYKHLIKVSNNKISIFDKNSTEFISGIIVITSYLAKGLEFDAVIIPNVDCNNYSTSIDKQVLYISCTRALHELYLYYSGERTPFLCFMDK